MSRSGYSDDCEYLGLWRGTVRRATNGKRGQQFFRDLVAALDAMPEKRLIANELETAEGEVCALGCLAKTKGATLLPLDTEDYDKLGETFDIARALAQEVMYENDEGGPCRGETDEQRWVRVRAWAAAQIHAFPAVAAPAAKESAEPQVSSIEKERRR
jgi:hypothetical protein